MTLTLLLRFWREALIAALVGALMASCVTRDHRIAAGAIAQERGRQADSTLRVITPQLLHTDTLLVHDTIKVWVAVERVLTLRDTVLRHLTDTVLVKEFVARADSAARACSDLLNDCAAFRLQATATIAAWKAKAEAAPMIISRSCVESNVIVGVAGAVIGYVAHRR